MRIETIKKSMPLVGQKHLLAHMDGKRLSFKQGIQAKCYECMNGFIDGKADCRIHDCPLYPWMPYSTRKHAKKHVDLASTHFGRVKLAKMAKAQENIGQIDPPLAPA